MAADLALARSRGYFGLLGTGPLYPWRPGKGYFPEGRFGPMSGSPTIRPEISRQAGGGEDRTQ